jgi:CHAT domain-containing protein
VPATGREKKPISAAVLRKLSSLADGASRQRFLKSRPDLLRKSVALYLNDVVRSQLRSDTRQALFLAEAAVVIARRVRSREALGRSLRSKANALYILGENKSALDFHAQALAVFRQVGDAREQARTLIPTIQPFILLGEYQRAFDTAAAARRILEQIGDEQRLGHLEINVGNIYHRQDRFEEALACYERAYECLLPFRDSEGLAVALYNMAVCLISLNDFPRALASYQRAREMCVRHGMTLLVTQADYNIAYLYYLRGEYSRAIEMLRETREKSEQNGDAHILALCYLDLSDIYLELNLSTEAREVAHEGWERFRKLGMGYEEAKCQANEAVALSQLGKAIHALELFDRARAKFVQEKNLVWPWLIDLYRALVLFNEGRFFESRRFCDQAAKFFDTSFLPNKAVLCHLLLARLSFRAGDLATAQNECARVVEHLSSLEAPALRFQAEFLSGQIAEACGAFEQARNCFQRARDALETLRSGLHGEELKIAFVRNRLEVYECLVDICTNHPQPHDTVEEAFGYMEMAKSRSLAELLVHHAQALPEAPVGQSGLVHKIREMREELNWYYRRLEIEQLQSGTPSPERIEDLRQKAAAKENSLLRAIRELPGSHNASHDVAPESAASIRESLPPDAAMIEYFVVKGQFVAALLTRRSLEIVPLTPVSRVVNLMRMLEFQISKFRLGGGYTRQFEKPLLDATKARLRNLHAEVFAPLRSRLSAKHLVVVPHGVLHYLPFQALLEADRYLIDDFSISYAPSATTFALCQKNSGRSDGAPLVMGIPDLQAPFILDEVEAVAKILPGATLLLGSEANDANLREKGNGSRAIHIATHGTFRRDNPMFSSIRLGGGNLALYDLYRLKLDCELMTLSGCATGLNVVTAGDELLGLVRGLLLAGARSLLLSLWDVHDHTTAEFMTAFYERLRSSESKAAALQQAMLAMRDRRPHPYYWAPFTLTGKVSAH